MFAALAPTIPAPPISSTAVKTTAKSRLPILFKTNNLPVLLMCVFVP